MLELMAKRRSIRLFQDKPVEKEKVDQIVKAALLAPSARNRKPCRLIVVDDKELLCKLSECRSAGGGFLKEAALAVVVLADEDISDVWIEDASILAAYIQLETEALGLNSCWCQIRERKFDDSIWAEEKVQALFGLAKNLKAQAIIGIGYGNEVKGPHTDDELAWDHVSYNRFGTV